MVESVYSGNARPSQRSLNWARGLALLAIAICGCQEEPSSKSSGPDEAEILEVYTRLCAKNRECIGSFTEGGGVDECAETQRAFTADYPPECMVKALGYYECAVELPDCQAFDNASVRCKAAYDSAIDVCKELGQRWP